MKRQDIAAAVMTSLLKLMKKKSFSEITVSDITDEAGISRMTFYRNFASKENVISDLSRNIGAEIHAFCMSAFAKNGWKSYFYELFERLSEYGDELLELHEADLGGIVLKRLNEFMSETLKPESKQSKYKLYQLTGAFYNIFIEWLLSEREESCERMAEICCEVMSLPQGV